MLDEAKRLFDMGLAVHWLKPNSKAPVKSGWSGTKRDEWEDLKASYKKGYGLGVRLGKASKIGGCYLANIDIDVKSGEQADYDEALALVRKTWPGLLKNAPCVKTGKGFRLFCVTTKEAKSKLIGRSTGTCKTFMPAAEVSAKHKSLLTSAEIAEGLRIRPRWEVEFMGSGRQVVVPPSVHMDTKKPYRWLRSLKGVPPVVAVPEGTDTTATSESGPPLSNRTRPFSPVESVDTSRLSASMRKLIAGDDPANDRSVAALKVALAMLRKGFTDDEVLTVVTERGTYLGDACRDHRNGVRWAEKYVLGKAKSILDDEMMGFDKVDEAEPARAAIEEGGDLPEDVGGASRVKVSKKGKKRPGTTRGFPQFEAGKNGPAQTLKNAEAALKAVGLHVIKYDEFAERDRYGMDTPWGGKEGDILEDKDTVLARSWCGDVYGYEPSPAHAFDAMIVIGQANRYHPVREAFEAAPPWDGTPRLDTWLKDHFNAEGPDEYLAQVFRKWMVASVTRVYHPGAKVDWMPIFEGGGGSGKSSFGRILAHQDNVDLMHSKYFLEGLPDLKDKDAALNLQGNLFVEFGELTHMRKEHVDQLKAYITRSSDKVRAPFGRHWREYPRQCVFYGTTNAKSYLKDEGGNRRFNPVKVGLLDFEQLAKDRAQLWAEAYFIFANGLEATLELTGEAKGWATHAQEDKLEDDPSDFMVPRLEALFAKQAPFEGSTIDTSSFRMTELFESGSALAEWPKTKQNQMLAAKALRTLGFEKYRGYEGSRKWRQVSPIC